MSRDEARCHSLFEMLAGEEDYRPAHYFSAKLGISEKTLYTDINLLNQELAAYGMAIDKTPRRGLRLAAERKRIEAYQEAKIKEAPDAAYTPGNRQRLIAKELLLDGNTVTYDELQGRFYISNSSLRNDIDQLRGYFQLQNVQIAADAAGITAKCSEIDRQRAYKKYEIDYYDRHYRSAPTAELVLEESRKLFSDPVIGITTAVIEDISHHIKRQISDYYLIALYYSLGILITRAQKECHILNNDKKFIFQNIQDMEPYLIAVSIATKVNNELGIILDDQDTEFLSELLFAYGITPSALDTFPNTAFDEAVTASIKRMSEVLKVDLTQDSELHDSLLYHTVPMIYRLKNGFVIHNPLLDSIKKRYLVMFTLTWYVISVFEKKFDVLLNDDEVSFLTIHYQVAYTKKSKPKNILVVCPTGLATSELVFNQIKQLLPATDHIETASVEQVYANDISEVSFIISLSPLKDIKKKVIYVSPLITQSELNEITSYCSAMSGQIDALRDTGSSNLLGLTNYLDDGFLFWNMELDSKEAALDVMIRRYEEKDFVTEGFRQSIYFRETQGTTSMSGGVAMPHAAPNTVKKTLISIMTLKKSIRWDANEVNTVILIAVAEKDVAEAKGIIAKLYELIESQEGKNRLTEIHSTAELALMLQQGK